MKILCIFGTRPEAIKFAPLVQALETAPEFDCRVCVTGQHREMLDAVLSFFAIRPHFDLAVMKPGQDLFDVTTSVLAGLKSILVEEKPDLVFVQGDTTTVFAAALAASYLKIPVAHLEAGLRSGDRHSPFPEEINRILAGHLADYHFAATEGARANLTREGITGNVHVVGNTVIDALLAARKRVSSEPDRWDHQFADLDFSKRVILVTGHRRESFGEPFRDLCGALKRIADTFQDSVELVYPVHLNPNVQAPVRELLADTRNIHLLEPLDYPCLVRLLDRSHLVLTDSGGIQEEAPALGKPVLVMRDVTERQEGIDAGTALLVGTDPEKIFTETSRLLTDEDAYHAMARAVNPYGDGHAAERIVEILRHAAIGERRA